ncbi:methyl-accepting chemotaxis protein [Phenylobacterium sp. LjRoot225]|uniref:methyl-accepting chemotaxis protein n=1 Tax=Phenylobacterium sp. LjRoot225 TaxID=3342285 RepID=UPI003ECEFBD3
MKNLTIRHRILGSFGLIIGLVAVMGALTYVRLEQIERHAAALLSDSIAGLQVSGELKGALADNYTHAERSRLRNEDGARLAASTADLQRLLGAYQATVFTDADRRNLEAAKTAIAAHLSVPQDASPAERDETYLKARDAVRVVADWNNEHAKAKVGEVVAEVAATQRNVVLVFGAALVAAFACAYFLQRAINGPLQRLLGVMDLLRQGDFSQRMAVERRDEFGQLAEGFNRMVDEVTGLVGQVQASGIQVNTSLTEIAATSKQQQATASEIAATTIQIGATSKEISATSRELVRTMGEVSTVAEQTASLAGAGQSGLVKMEETMHQVTEAAASISAKLAVLNDRASNINQVVTTITKVADQTNLLSLNAAIEAEKAGEYGRGFAVVATEIRRLADQTAVATYDIEQMVKEIQTAISAGVMGMDKFSEEVRHGMQNVEQVGAQLSQIIQQVQALAPEFETVNDGMQAQATGAEQISQALLQLTEAAQQTVESLQQSSSAIDDLNTVSSGLRSSVAKFKLEAA